MRSRLSIMALVGIGALVAVAQALSFELASVKPSAPRLVPLSRTNISAGRVNFTNVTVKMVLMQAYQVKQHQVTGPSWLDSERFDIVAKIPEGGSASQVPAMLQTLLNERFKMVIRHETSAQPAYILLVGKNGPRLTRSTEADVSLPGGMPPLPAGAPAGAGANAVRGVTMISPTGHIRLRKGTLSQFSEIISSLMDLPVSDMTGLKGEFDIDVTISPEDMHLTRPSGFAAGLPVAVPSGEAGERASIFAAVEQLGLKLERRRIPTAMIVVEKADKQPIEN